MVKTFKAITKRVKTVKITPKAKAQIKAKRGTLTCRALQSKRPGMPARLRKSITPGTVLILLTGANRGKRVVFLKQLKSGLLLVSGPFKVNGVPVRRVNQAFVIATSTRVALNDAVNKAIANVDDAFFTALRPKALDQTRGKKFIAVEQAPKTQVNDKRVQLQKAVDGALLPIVKAVGKEFVAYLGSRFQLTKNQFPHQLKF